MSRLHLFQLHWKLLPVHLLLAELLFHPLRNLITRVHSNTEVCPIYLLHPFICTLHLMIYFQRFSVNFQQPGELLIVKCHVKEMCKRSHQSLELERVESWIVRLELRG